MKIKSLLRNSLYLLLVGLLTGYLAACQDDDLPNDDGKEEIDNSLPFPTEDVVETYISTPAVMLFNGASDQLAMRLQKRLSNLSLDVNKDTRLILLDETTSAQALKDDEQWKAVKEAWLNGAIVGCVNPGYEWFSLYTALGWSAQAFGEETTNWDLMKEFEKTDIHLAMANGSALYQEKIYNPDTPRPVINISETTDKNGVISHDTTIVMAVDSVQPTDYQWGGKAEAVAEWIKGKLNAENKASTRGVLDSNFFEERQPAVKVHYDVWGTDDYDLYPVVKLIVSARCAFSEQHNADIYDVEITEEFPANETWKGRYSEKKKASYIYKLAGHSYIGPKVKCSLHGGQIQDADISIFEPAPKNESGSTNITHDPGGLSFGANVMGSFVPGNKNTPGSQSGGGGLSMSYQLPKDIKMEVIPNMAVEYAPEKRYAEWSYNANGPYYSGAWGSNSGLNEPPLITRQYCITKQAVTFYVKNSRNIGNKNIDLRVKLDFRTGWAEGTPWEDIKHTDSHSATYNLPLPKVNRYFGRYTPTVEGKISNVNDWNNLHTMFKNGNLGYQSLCDNSVRIGATTSGGLKKEAETIWNKIIDQLINTYGETETEYEYTVVLKDENNNSVGNILFISPNGWKNKKR